MQGLGRGFTIIELLVVIVILGILLALGIPQLLTYRERGYFAKANTEFTTMRTGLQLYLDYYGEYPPDANRNLPPGLEEFLAGSDTDNWPNAPWPGSVYDYDAYEVDGEPVTQVSIRFCEIGNAASCRFPRATWADDFLVDSSLYFCIEGSCKAHPNRPSDYPGHCVNCRFNED